MESSSSVTLRTAAVAIQERLGCELPTSLGTHSWPTLPMLEPVFSANGERTDLVLKGRASLN